MTINNPDKFLESIWDWSILKGCFGNTRIMPTDVDGEVERNGKFLRFETKSLGVEVPTGQMIMFKKLIDTGYFTVVIIWGDPGNPEKILLMTSKATIEYDRADLDKLRHIVSSWFMYANSTPEMRFTE